MSFWQKFKKDNSAAVSMEYGLAFALLLVVCIASIQKTNEAIKKNFYCSTPDQQNANKEVCTK